MKKLRILTWRHYSGLFKWVEYNHRDPEEREKKREGQRKTPRAEAEFKDRKCFTVAFEDGRRNPESRNVDSLQKLEKVKK